MTTFELVRKRLTALLVSVCLALGLTATPAMAGVSVTFDGSTTWGVKAKANTTKDSLKVGKKVTGIARIKYYATAAGIPVPATAYYTNSFPVAPFRRPVLKEATAALDSTTYKKVSNRYLGKKQWEVNGKRHFAGFQDVKVKGQAKGKAKRTGFFYSGTHNCGRVLCDNGHAIVRLTVK